VAYEKTLVLGKGKLYFEQFAPGQTQPTGKYRFIGNCPTFNVNQEVQTLDHYQSTGGIRVKDASVTLQTDMGGQFTTDDVTAENLALLFNGTAAADTVGTASGLSQTFTNVQLDSYVQVGTSSTKPDGVGNLTNVVVVTGGDTLVAGTDYDVDVETGMIYLRADAPDLDNGDSISVSYGTAAGTRSRVVDSTNAIYGALRFISDNPYGPQRDYTVPYVKVQASGDYGLISDEWATMTFDFEVQQTATGKRLIATGRYD
jgi:hypothetical protein